MVRFKGENVKTTNQHLTCIVNSLFPKSFKAVTPKDIPLNIFVKIIHFISQVNYILVSVMIIVCILEGEIRFCNERYYLRFTQRWSMSKSYARSKLSFEIPYHLSFFN
jgi:hypothetical protein